MKLLNSEEAISEIMGHIIILSITVIGVALITLVGIPSIFNLQNMVIIRNVEQAFTSLDSRASSALLGDSPMQVIDINLGGGSLAIEPNGTGKESYITIKREKENDILIIPMGKIEYRLGDRMVAYEGGGIWSKYPSGSVMLSPPEFHYNGKTLTLPAISVIGSAAIGGKGTAAVSFKKNTTLVMYPSISMGVNRTNPLDYSTNGKVYVNITSDFYDAWADYAKNLMYTTVSTNKTDRTTSIVLTVIPTTFGGATEITNPIGFRGFPSEEQPLNNFSFKIRSTGGNLQWDIRATSPSGDKQLIFFLKDINNWAENKKVTLQIGYIDSNIEDRGETWEGYGIYTIQHDKYIYVDLLDKNINLTYTMRSVGADNGHDCQPFGGRINGIINPAKSWDDLVINTSANNTQPLYNITQHYFWKLSGGDDIYFNQCTTSNANQSEPDDTSTMITNYNATGAITFLYISNNTVDVNVD